MGTSSSTSRLARTSSLSAPPWSLDGALSQSRPASSSVGMGTGAPLTASATRPTDGGSGKLSGISLQENAPVIPCRPAGRRTPGRSSIATTAVGLPSTLTSSGQCFASPGRGTQTARKTTTS